MIPALSPANAPWLAWPETKRLLAAFAAAEAPLRFVGGCVRDSLLGRDVKEVDAATPLLPEAVMALFEKQAIRALPTGIIHGTVTALVEGRPFEITTLRRDMECDGRHAEVAYTDNWQEDAARRDFTINALYADAEGTVCDYFGGVADLAPLTLRFIGDPRQRIREDGLRILRLFRFMAQLQPREVDASALDACRALASHIERLSGERIAQEMLKLLEAENPLSALEALQASGALPWLCLPPAPPAMEALLALERRHRLASNPLRCLALWLNGDAAACKAVCERWKLSNAQQARLAAVIQLAKQMRSDLTQAEQKKLLRKAGADVFTDAACIALAQETHGEQALAAMLALAQNWQPPRFPLSGQDLLERGFRPGPEVGETLRALEAQWEAEDYAPAREALLARLPVQNK